NVIRFTWFAVGKVIRNIKFATAFFVALFSPKGVCQCSAVFFVPLSQIAAAVLRRAPNIRTWLVWLLLAQKQRGCWPRSKADTLTKRSSRSLRLLGLSKAALLPSPVLGVRQKENSVAVDAALAREIVSGLKWYFQAKNLALKNALSIRCPLSVDQQNDIRI